MRHVNWGPTEGLFSTFANGGGTYPTALACVPEGSWQFRDPILEALGQEKLFLRETFDRQGRSVPVAAEYARTWIYLAILPDLAGTDTRFWKLLSRRIQYE